MKLRTHLTLAILLCAGVIYSQNKQVKNIPFSATFVKKHLEEVGLSKNQWDVFYKLCFDLDQDIKALRKETNVTKELIKKRDEVYKEMMKDPKLSKSEYLGEMGRRLHLTKNQLRGFSEAIVLKGKFNKDVLKVLDTQQKLKFSEVKKMKQKRKNKDN